jgi:hypothetical protein
MKRSLESALRARAAALGILGLLALGAAAQGTPPSFAPAPSFAVDLSLETVLSDWPENSRFAAREMIAKYGEPIRVGDDKLVWPVIAPWSKIVVYRRAPRGLFGWRGEDVVEQSIWYFVPDDKVADLARFDDRLTWDMSTGELSSRAESEGLNFLALNLADEIVAGTRTPSQAREFYRRTVQLSESGKSSPYMSGIIFSIRIPPPPDDGSTTR